LASVSMPDLAGNDSFMINVEVKNEGKVDANIQYTVSSSQGETIDNRQITIHAGETKLLQYSRQIPATTNYAFMFTGDLNQTIIKSVVYGLAGKIEFRSQESEVSSIYPEGKIAIPVTITNTGQLDAGMEVSFQFSSQQSVVSSQNKTYYISKGGSISDTLYYDLTEGSYQITASSQNPAAGSQANFSVLKENKVDMAVSVGVQTASLIPVTVNITNTGYNSINGSVRCRITDVWSGEQAITQLATNNSQLVTFNVNPAALAPGDYTLTAEFLNNSGQQIVRSAECKLRDNPTAAVPDLCCRTGCNIHLQGQKYRQPGRQC